MTQLTIRSKMAELANEHGGERPTEWSGTVDLSEVAALTDSAADTVLKLEAAFRYFNRVDDADVDRLERDGYNLPSLSVGDQVTMDGRTFEVAPTGFTEIR